MDKKVIENIIEYSIINILSKCSNDEIRSKLSNLSSREKYLRLKDKLNPAEQIDYANLLDYVSNGLPGTYNIFESESLVKECEKEIFNYEKRIFNGYKLNNNNSTVEIPKGYKTDRNQNDNGKMESSTIDEYSSIKYTSNEVSWLDDYFGGGYAHINGKIYGTESWKKAHPSLKDYYAKEWRNCLNNMDKAIGKSYGLPQDTILHRIGHFDFHLNVGDRGTLKGYTSTSFQKDGTVSFEDAYNRGLIGRWDIDIYAPKGTKGACGNSESLNGFAHEHEYLLGRNQDYIVLETDPINMKAVILLTD